MRIQIAQKQAEQEVEELDLFLNLAQAEKSHRVARLYADIDPQLLARSEAEKYRFEADQSQLEIEKANERLLQSRGLGAGCPECGAARVRSGRTGAAANPW